MQLRAALEEEPGKLPGFMRMCDCLVRTDDPGGGRARFSGMIMEKLNGKPRAAALPEAPMLECAPCLPPVQLLLRLLLQARCRSVGTVPTVAGHWAWL